MPRYFMSETRWAGLTGSPRGLPRGGRRRSGASESCRLRRGEGYGACGDAMMDSSRSVPRPKTKQKRPQKKLPCNRPVKPQPPKPTNEEAGV